MIEPIENVKAYPIELWHLSDEKELYSPNGNYAQVVNDGWFGGEVVYEPKTKKVYRPCLIEVKDVNPTFIDMCEHEQKVKELRALMSNKNIDKLLEVAKELQ